MDQIRLSKILAKLDSYKLRYATVISAPGIGTFSSIKTTNQYLPYSRWIKVTDIFAVPKDTLMGKYVKNLDSVTRLISVLNNTEALKSFYKALNQPREAEQFIHFASLILHPLTNSCTLSTQEYSAKLLNKFHPPAVVDFEYIGMGDINTWPDCLTNINIHQGRASIEGGDFSVTALSAVPSVECTDNTSEESFGAKMTIEAKKGDVDIAEMNQIVGHTVVMSFIHQHRHESQHSLVPAVGISCETGEFIAAFYDCTNDVLLHLQPTRWNHYPDSNSLDESGITLLWLIVHHELILKKTLIEEDHKSRLISTI